MILAPDGSSVDGSASIDTVHLARHAPVSLDETVSAWATYGPGLFAVLMTIGWWHARRMGATASVLRRRAGALTRRLTATRLRPLLTTS